MGAVRLRFTHRGVLSSGAAPVYDSRYGTAVDSSGWFTFLKKSTCRYVYLNGGATDDTGDGLSAATAKKTLAAAVAVWLGTGFTAGDQLLIAKGFTYTDPGTTATINGFGGFSATYPLAVLSYDPADPTNTALYGRYVGPDMPVVNMPTTGNAAFGYTGDTGFHWFAIQGVAFTNATRAAGISLLHQYRHDGVVLQNCRFDSVIVSRNNASSPNGLTSGGNISKCSFVGAWSTDGNSENLYMQGNDGLWVQDNVFAHGAWKIGASRDDATTAGGTSSGGQGHNFYYHATNINGRFDRNFGVDASSDTFNFRGSCTAIANVALDDPIAGNFTGISGAYSEAPSGSVVVVTDFLAMGGANINSSAPRGYGPRWGNAAATGCSLDNALLIDNPIYGGVNNYTMQADASNSGVTSAAITLNRITGWNYASTLQLVTGTQTITLNWTNSITDTLASGASNSVWTGTTFPLAKTRDQIVSALLTAASVTPGASYTARKAQMVNLMLYRPDLDWARYLITIAFPAFNKTQSLASLSPPNLSAITPATIY